MFWKLVTPFGLMLFGALVAYVTGFNPLTHTNEILIIGSLFLSTALFANVQAIDASFLKRNQVQSIVIVSIGLLFKALLLGGILYVLFGDIRFFLVGALISQIDPSLTNWANKVLGRTGDSAKLSLVESTFDDPVSTLLTLYIALPLVLGSALKFNVYFFMLLANFVFVAVFIFERRRAKIESSFLSSATIVIGGLLNVFLGVALSGLVLRMRASIFDEPVRLITYASYIIIGLFLPYVGIHILAGVTLAAVLVLIVRPLEVAIFFRGMTIGEKVQMALAEQKGITTILLLLLVQPQVNIIGIVIPAILAINAWFVLSHSLVSAVMPQHSAA